MLHFSAHFIQILRRDEELYCCLNDFSEKGLDDHTGFLVHVHSLEGLRKGVSEESCQSPSVWEYDEVRCANLGRHNEHNPHAFLRVRNWIIESARHPILAGS